MNPITLTADSMLELWKTAKGFEPLRTDCTVSRSDGPDLDRILTLQMRAWYVGLLNTAPFSDLPLTDIGPRLTFSERCPGSYSARLPDGCLRVASADCDSWERPALIVTDPASPDAAAQSNPFARSGRARPVAVVGDGLLTVQPPPDGGKTRIMAVMLPDSDDIYHLTPQMLASLGVADPNLFIC